MITIDKELLEALGSCEPGVEWFAEDYGSATFESAEDVRVFIENLDCLELKYANWLLCRLLPPDQCAAYADNAAAKATDATKWTTGATKIVYWGIRTDELAAKATRASY